MTSPSGSAWLAPGSLGLTFLLGALAALPPLSIDMNLPALPGMAASFGAAPERAAATLSVFLAGFAASQLAYGPASDRFGRKPVLLFGCALFVLASVACAFATSLGSLVAWRGVQGAGAGAGMVLVRAIVRDLFQEPAAARVQFSHINMVMQVAPVAAPVLGGAVLWIAGGAWRPIFACLAVAGLGLLAAVAFSLPESLRDKDPDAFRPQHVLRNYGRFLRHRDCLGYSLIAGLAFGSLFAFVSGSPLVFRFGRAQNDPRRNATDS